MPRGAALETFERILIVGTGPSVEGVDIPTDLPAHIIAVNGAIEWLPRADSFFSLDPSYYVRSLLQKRRDGTVYYVAVPEDYGQPDARVFSHRRPADSGVVYLRRIVGSGLRGACYGLSEEEDAIHTGNSLYGALGLAYLMRPKKIAILGLDGTQRNYAFRRDGPRLSFEHLPDLFASALPQMQACGIEIMNGSMKSLIRCFPRCKGGGALEWLIS